MGASLISKARLPWMIPKCKHLPLYSENRPNVLQKSLLCHGGDEVRTVAAQAKLRRRGNVKMEETFVAGAVARKKRGLREICIQGEGLLRCRTLHAAWLCCFHHFELRQIRSRLQRQAEKKELGTESGLSHL
mmetsp:Transcript_8842/g.23211  ORF Transcript_8842/g.23211 Transcript_8842/m.23211 type:complete len:132 (-) Transcript_8842:2424-2819(-)